MKTNPFTNYVKWLVHQIQELHQVTPHNFAYKIVDKVKCTKTGEEIFVIQIAGKNAFLHLSPHDLVRDDAMLRGFSPLDIRTITYIACHIEKPAREESKSLYRIVAQFFSRTKKSEMFTIQPINETVQITKSAQDISSDPILIRKLGPEDAHRIGYVTGAEQTAAENDFLIHATKDKHTNL